MLGAWYKIPMGCPPPTFPSLPCSAARSVLRHPPFGAPFISVPFSLLPGSRTALPAGQRPVSAEGKVLANSIKGGDTVLLCSVWWPSELMLVGRNQGAVRSRGDPRAVDGWPQPPVPSNPHAGLACVSRLPWNSR